MLYSKIKILKDSFTLYYIFFIFFKIPNLLLMHLDVKRAAEDDAYVDEIKSLLKRYNLEVHALATHIIGQCVGDYNDPRLNNFAPPELADQPEKIRA